jgi:hypothetical protein
MLSGRAKRDYARKALTPKTDGERVAALEAERLTTNDAEGAVNAPGTAKLRPRQRRVKRAAETVTDRAPCGAGVVAHPKGKNARFLPGHDARWHSAQKRAAARTG